MRIEVPCDTPYCEGKVMSSTTSPKEYHFCDECKSQHSYHALVIQTEHGKPIREIILESRYFKGASRMADYIGVSFVTLYHWLDRYFGMTFQEFKRAHICQSENCYLLDIRRSSYTRNDYVLRKIRAKRYCACVNALEKDHVMTDAPLEVIQEIFRGAPKVKKINDNRFELAYAPFYMTAAEMLKRVWPVYVEKVKALANPFYSDALIKKFRPLYTDIHGKKVQPIHIRGVEVKETK